MCAARFCEANFMIDQGSLRHVRIKRPNGTCEILGELLYETTCNVAYGYRALGTLVTYRRKKDLVHLDPCPDCPDYAL